jgi:hypothetical protein
LNNTGEQRALVINVARADGFAAPRDKVQASYAEGAKWMHIMSRGQLTITVDMFPRDVVVSIASEMCTADERGINHHGPEAFSNNALEQVRREISTDAYRFISFVLPVYEGQTENCASGWGYVGGSRSMNHAFAYNGETFAPWVGVIAHEWGHNVGLRHANTLFCDENGQPVAFSAKAARAGNTCRKQEYGSPYSVMGTVLTNPEISMGERQLIGWLRAGEQTSVSDATITLHRDGPVSLAWVRNSDGDVFQVELVSARRGDWFYDYRAGVSRRNSSAFTHSGVLVKFVERVTCCSNDAHYVLDMNPQTSWMEDAPLRGQQSWTDPTGSVTITVLSVLGDTATVHIRGQAVLPTEALGIQVLAAPELGVVDVAWQKPASLFPISHYEVRVYEGAEQREIHLVGVTALKTQLQVTAAAWGTDYWVSVRAVTEVGVGAPSAFTPVRWEQPKKPCTGKKAGKRCK